MKRFFIQKGYYTNTQLKNEKGIKLEGYVLDRYEHALITEDSIQSVVDDINNHVAGLDKIYTKMRTIVATTHEYHGSRYIVMKHKNKTEAICMQLKLTKVKCSIVGGTRNMEEI